MSLRSHSFWRGMCKTYGRRFSTVTKVKDEQVAQVCSFRTTENNPVNHNADHIARLYTVPTDICEQLFQHNILHPVFRTQVTTFQECAFLIRQPAIEIMSYLNQADLTRPVNKYVLYGKYGTGKSIIMNHILHYGFMQKYLLVHVFWAPRWLRNTKEVAASALSPGCVDLPIDAGVWLKQFKFQNSTLLSQLDLKTTKDYEWNKREMTPQGIPIIDLIDFGISRIKYGCGVVEALIREIKLASTAGKCKTLVIVDGFNSFTSGETRIFDDNKVMIPPEKVSLLTPFFDITKSNWCNGAIVLTVDKMASTQERQDSDLPRYLLGKEGFEHLDPFIPVLVENYNDAEFDSIIEYYKDRKWIRNITPTGQKEIELLSNKNPLNLMEQCKFL
ncbi:hypothetical protein PUN28_017545 [Cardiocondyla obscurior]|uniref:Small ribosomal subunit protein mS29 n=1 Tax=Cardiocondyla obscurior TaxID=286306 RepID=A0AAW2EMQ6_9HYME